MSSDQTDETKTEDTQSEDKQSTEPRTDEHHNVLDEPEERPPTEKPEVTDEHHDKAKEYRREYEEERPTIKLPGSDGTVAGTAVNDWVDDDGNPKFGNDEKGEEGQEDEEDKKDQESSAEA